MGNVIAGSCVSGDGIKNCCCAGKPDETCKCCYCCLSEEHRVGRVFDHFQPSPLSVAVGRPNAVGMYVGRVTLPMNPQVIGMQQFCYSPGTQRPCVYWRVEVEEQWVTWHKVDDYVGEGDDRRKVR
eukprot:SAG11_NODE_8505_length_1008_cov_1.306931_2_plen_126_part_00